MTITEQQAAERIKGIGSSEAAAVLGISPFLTPYEVWMNKTGRSEGFKGNLATKRGDFFEDAILQMVAEEIGQPVVKPSSTFVRGVLRANVDGMVGKYQRGSVIVECKSSLVKDGWGEPGTDEIPPHVMIQVQHQMLCAESPECVVAKLGFTMWPDIYRVQFDRDLADLIAQECAVFWERHVVADIAPPITQATDGLVQAMSRMKRTRGGAVRVDPAICREYVEAKADESRVSDRVSKAKAMLLAAIGDHQDFESEGFKCNLTWVKGRTTVDADALKTHHPDIYATVLKTGGGYPRITVKENA